MLFHSNVRTEIARSFGATLVVLATVVMTVTMIRLLGQASRGRLSPEDVALVLTYTVLSYTPTLLTMSLFIAVVATMSRMHQDSEMAIWHNSGRGLAAFIKPVFRFAWPVFALIALLSLVVLPWTNLRIDELRHTYQSRGDVQRIERGLFTSSADGRRVFFIDKSSPDAQVGTNVFIASHEQGKKSITSAQRGRTEAMQGDRFLVLEAGQRLEINDQQQSIKLSRFQSYELRLDQAIASELVNISTDTISTAELAKGGSPAAWGELSRRLGLIFSAVNLVALGICLSKVSVRSGKTLHVAMALFVFIVYFNLIGLGQSWISAGRISPAALMAVLHGGVAAISFLWIAGIHHNWSIRRAILQTGVRP